MLNATLFLMALGFLAAVMLAISSKIFYVWEDPKIEQVEDALLGANCGGCGYAGCAAAAEAVVLGKASVDVCVAGGFEIIQNVGAIMGLTVEEKAPEIAKLGCIYSVDDADVKYTYDGVSDCRAAMLLYGGTKDCLIGCLGLGTCVRACPFGALSMGENNLPVVNKNLCTSCGICAQVCPKGIITLTSATRRIMADYKVTECTAPCQRHCPAEIDIPEYIRQINQGNYLDAVRVIKEKNPFPLVCGWICPAPCEFECRRNLIDEPVSINALKKFVAEYEMKTGERMLPYLPPASGKNIAVVGGGIEGLTAAYYLRRLGHIPKIYEATSKMGGILRRVITEDRLPRDILDWEIDGILEIGVEAATNQVMGRDFTLSSLFQDDVDMVLFTTGGWDSRQILLGADEVESPIPGTHLLLDFLIAASKGVKKSVGKKVAIIGGGKAAPRAANICLNNGAEDVVVIYPFSEDEAKYQGIDLKIQENITFLFSAVPAELQGKGQRLTELAIRYEDGNTETISLDTLIVGTGRYPEMLIHRIEDDEWKTAGIFKVFSKEADIGIFAVGQVGRTTDHTGVVVAIGRGRKIARAIQLYASEETIAPEECVITDESELQDVFEIANANDLQVARGVIDAKDSLTEEQTQREATRCLNCGLICYKKDLDESLKQEISV